MKRELFFIDIFLCLFFVIFFPRDGYSQVVTSVNCKDICVDFGGTIQWSSYKICGEESPFRFVVPVTCETCCFDTLGNTGDCILEVLPSYFIPVSIPTCQPQCLSVDPAFGGPGETIDVTITGENTHFDTTSVVTFSCAAIAVNSVTANSATSIIANITIAEDATLCQSDINVTTGSEVVTCVPPFEIPPPPSPKCVSVVPLKIQVGETKDVVIKLEGIDLTGITDDINVVFGCAGVTVNSSTVTSATEITANITVSKTAQDCTGDVTITGVDNVGIVCPTDFKI